MAKQRAIEANQVHPVAGEPSPEVQPPVERRPRSAAEKLRILHEYDSDPVGSPERGALLRREGIYTSQISKWRKRHAGGGVQALRAQPRGPKPVAQDALQVEVERLRRENARFAQRAPARLAQAETIIEVQKKVGQLLGAALPPTAPDES